MKLLAVVLLLVLPAESQVAWPASGPELCTVPTTLPIRPTSTCSDFGNGASCEALVIDIAAQRGEVESAQLLLRFGSDQDTTAGLTNVTLSVRGIPPTVAVASVFQVGFVLAAHSPRYQGSGGGWRPDPLLPPPAEGGFDVSPDQAQPIFIEFTIADAAPPGTYAGTVEIQCDAGACGKMKPVPLALTVWNSTMPSLADSKIGTAWSGAWTGAAFADYYGEAYWQNDTNKHQWYDLLLKSRTPPDSIYQSPTSLRPIDDYVYLASKGVQWLAILDVTSLPLTLTEGAPVVVGAATAAPRPSPGGFRGARVQGSCANYTDEYVARLVATLKPIVAALDAAGIVDRAYIYGFDENPVSCEPQVRKLFGATKKAFPKLRTSAVLNWSPMPVDLPVDVWILQYQEFKSADAAKWAAAGKDQWQYHCIEPHSLQFLNTFIERRPIQARLLFWLAALMQAEHGAPNGWLYYAVNLWRPCKGAGCGGAHTPAVMRRKSFGGSGGGGGTGVGSSADAPDPRAGFKNLAYTDFPPANYIWQPTYDDIFANGDGQYVYPCEGGPCSTIRLSAIRDGLEDWELFAALGAERATPLLKRLVRSASDWTEDAALLEETRREAAEMLSGE